MHTFTTVKSKLIPIIQNNIDTDQIIPARYLKVIDKSSLAEGLFSNWRYDSDGAPKPDFPLNQPDYQTAHVLLAGDNFGCGSSREHAPWALTGWGIQAVISTSFADIFRNNALKNGLLPITVSPEVHSDLVDLVEEAPSAEIAIDLESQTVSLPGGSSFEFEIDPFAKKCMLTGVDQLGYILSFEEAIKNYEQQQAIIIS
ncbi:MAG: 3-isopropylmalate dehydratase small subunit [Anaerolineales bacterium]|nr:3-isopropylmalate dehydratase small subunit [Anaerolineales bacterium]